MHDVDAGADEEAGVGYDAACYASDSEMIDASSAGSTRRVA